MEKDNNTNSNSKSEIDKELEEIKKQFFVDADSFEDKNLKKYLERLMKFSKMTPKGQVIIEDTELSDIDIIAVIALTHYLGNKLNAEIDETVKADEISDVTKIEKKIIRAQISKLVKKRIIVKPELGVYKFNPRKISEFLSKLESQTNRKQ